MGSAMSANFSEDNHQQLGALRAEVANVKEDVSEIKSDVREMREILHKVEGSWKTISILIGISAAVGALFAKLAAWLPFLSGK
jgi:hypothetical protein